MGDFICRICGHDSCYMIHSQNCYDHFKCEGCGIIFHDPISFTLPVVKFKRIHKDAVIPTRAKDGDVGYDVASIERIKIFSGCTVMIQTGISVELPPHTEMQVRPRSGLAKKHGIMVTNSPGTIDTGYRGPCNILLTNTGEAHYTVSKGDNIAQFLVTPKLPYRFVEVSELSDTDRGEGGFGHTGR